MKSTRREFLLGSAAVLAFAALNMPLPAFAAGTKIGIIGSGRIGGTLGELWAKAGNQVMFSDIKPETAKAEAEAAGPNATTGTAREAAAFGDAVLISIPFNALPQVGKDLADVLKGKIVLDTSNPYPNRDGDMAIAAKEKGMGIASAEYLPGVRLVRAFNSVNFMKLRSESGRAGDKVAIPLAADDKDALAMAEKLVRDAGFEPLVVGGLAKAKIFDAGSPGYGEAHTAAELRALLKL